MSNENVTVDTEPISSSEIKITEPVCRASIALQHFDDEDAARITGFEVSVEGLIGLHVSYSDIATVDKTAWQAFHAALQSGAKAELVFCDSNGHVSIDLVNGTVVMTTMKCGTGGDGAIDITLPLHALQVPLTALCDRILAQFA